MTNHKRIFPVLALAALLNNFNCFGMGGQESQRQPPCAEDTSAKLSRELLRLVNIYSSNLTRKKSRNRKLHLIELIEQGADVNQDSCDGSPLHIACFLRDAQVAKVLLEYGANPLQKHDGLTPLQAAAKDYSAPLHIVHLLLSTRRWRESHNIKNHRALTAEELEEWKRDAGIDIATSQDFPKFGGYTALHFAATLGRKTMINLLLAAGASPSAEGKNYLDLIPKPQTRLTPFPYSLRDFVPAEDYRQ